MSNKKKSKKASYKSSKNNKNINSKNLYDALKTGAFQYKRKPGLLKIVKLENYLKYCKNTTRLLEAIAFALIFDHSQKTSEIYQVAFNSNNLSKDKWKYHCPLSLKKDSIQLSHCNQSNSINLEDLIIIDFSILHKEKEKTKLFEEHPYLKQSLMTEVSRLWKILQV